ncbi:hypothetical protein MACK_002148 [Theileria orientalis]|uniref:Uncharacterized protein n=1 Tax=Theileria orientalis TaxID=68886 RepID=A0A976MBM5_THEOR|nr:hypothetical protein MACK_002148 [Theileria orientalis]
MAQLLNPESQYFFDLTDKKWWVLPKSGDEWKELSNDEAYKLGLFRAVLSQECDFIDTDVSEYISTVSDIVKELEDKFNPRQSNATESSPSDSKQLMNRIRSKDFLSGTEDAEKSKKTEQNVRFKEEPKGAVESDLNFDSTPDLSKQSSVVDQPPKKAENEGSENLLSQINDLIASTSQMKQICKAKELSAQNKPNAPTVRSTARHLTYVNNGGLAGCLKTVAEERKKMGNTKKVVSQSQNSQLQEMIQRAKAMAAKTMDEVKEPEQPAAVKKAPQPKKTQLRSNAKRYTTVFRPDELKELRMNHPLPDVKFEASSEEDSDEEGKRRSKQTILKDRNQTQGVARRPTLGR